MRTVILAALASYALLGGDTIAVGEKHSDSVTFYDGETGKTLKRLAVGHKPHEMVLEKNGRYLFVADYGLTRWTEPEPGGHTVTVIDVGNMAVAATIDLGTNHRPHGIEVGASGNIYVVSGRPGALLTLDPAKRSITRSRPLLEGKDPHMVVFPRDESKFYIANASSESVTVLAATGQKQIRIGGVPMGLAMTGDGKTVYATNRTGNGVAEIDTATDTVRRMIEISGEPVRARLIDGDRTLLVTTIVGGDLVVMDTATRRVIKRLHVGNQVEGLGVDTQEQNVYVSAQADNVVLRIRVRDWQPQNQIRTGERPDPIVVIPLAAR